MKNGGSISEGQTPPSFWAKPTPLYPVIEPYPTFTKVVGKINSGDLRRLATITEFSALIGYICGIRAGVKLHSTASGLASGLALGLYDAYASSKSRLTGFHPNDDDFTAAGKLQYPFTKVVANFNLHDYLEITSLTAVFAVFEYYFPRPMLRHFRGAAVWTSGLTALIAGSMKAYQDSHSRLEGFSTNNGEVAEDEKQGFEN